MPLYPRPKPHRYGKLTYYEWLAAVYRLGLKPCSQDLARYTGYSVRQLQKIYNHQAPIPAPMSRILSLMCAITGQTIPRFKETKRALELAAEAAPPPPKPKRKTSMGFRWRCTHGVLLSKRCRECVPVTTYSQGWSGGATRTIKARMRQEGEL